MIIIQVVKYVTGPDSNIGRMADFIGEVMMDVTDMLKVCLILKGHNFNQNKKFIKGVLVENLEIPNNCRSC